MSATCSLLQLTGPAYSGNEVASLSVCLLNEPWHVMACVGKFMEESKISGFHCGDYEDWRLLGCYAILLL
jgi:hypothetical protein